MNLDLAGNHRLLLSGAPCLQRKPLWLLLGEAILELVLEYDVKLAHVVLSKAVLVPADHLEQEALLADNGQFERLVPFRVQLLVDSGRRGLCIAQGEDEVLQKCELAHCLGDIYNTLQRTHGVRSAAPVFCSEVSALHGVLAGGALSSAGNIMGDGRTLMTFALNTRPVMGCSDIARIRGLPLRV